MRNEIHRGMKGRSVCEVGPASARPASHASDPGLLYNSEYTTQVAYQPAQRNTCGLPFIVQHPQSMDGANFNVQPLVGGGMLVDVPPFEGSSSFNLATSRCHDSMEGLGGRVCPDAMRNALCVGVRQAVLEVGVPRASLPIGCGAAGQGASKANAAKGLGATGPVMAGGSCSSSAIISSKVNDGNWMLPRDTSGGVDVLPNGSGASVASNCCSLRENSCVVQVLHAVQQHHTHRIARWLGEQRVHGHHP